MKKEEEQILPCLAWTCPYNTNNKCKMKPKYTEEQLDLCKYHLFNEDFE